MPLYIVIYEEYLTLGAMSSAIKYGYYLMLAEWRGLITGGGA